VLRRIFGLEREEIMESFIRYYMVIKSRRMRLAWHVAFMEDMKNAYKNLKGRNHFKDTGTDGRIILKLIL